MKPGATNTSYYLDFSGMDIDNLALDEALLLLSEERVMIRPILRIWEPSSYFLVLGYGSRAEKEINLTKAAKRRVPVCRRISGGCAVLQGPGCLNYSLILPIDSNHTSISATNRFLLKKMADSLQNLVSSRIASAGVSDLTLASRKFSGNSQRRLRHSLLFHGTILYQFDLQAIDDVLLFPPRQPDYRSGRSHTDFLTNLPAQRSAIVNSIREAWDARERLPELPEKDMRRLVAERYSRKEWTMRM